MLLFSMTTAAAAEFFEQFRIEGEVTSLLYQLSSEGYTLLLSEIENTPSEHFLNKCKIKQKAEKLSTLIGFTPTDDALSTLALLIKDFTTVPDTKEGFIELLAESYIDCGAKLTEVLGEVAMQREFYHRIMAQLIESRDLMDYSSGDPITVEGCITTLLGIALDRSISSDVASAWLKCHTHSEMLFE